MTFHGLQVSKIEREGREREKKHEGVGFILFLKNLKKKRGNGISSVSLPRISDGHWLKKKRKKETRLMTKY